MIKYNTVTLLTDSAVWPGETGSALAPKPVDSVHADAAVVTEIGEEINKKKKRNVKSHILSSCNKAHRLCVCVCVYVATVEGGHKPQFSSSIQASTFQMLIAVSSPSPPLLSSCLLKAGLPPRSHGKNGHVCPHPPPLHPPPAFTMGKVGVLYPPAQEKKPLSPPIQYPSPRSSPTLRDAPFEAWFKDDFHCF